MEASPEQTKIMTEKAQRRIDVMRSLYYTFNRKTHEKIYLTFIRPLLEYGSIIWDNCTDKEKEQLEAVQLSAARTVTGGKAGTSHRLLYKDTGWKPLQERRNEQKLIMLYKILKSDREGQMNRSNVTRVTNRNPYNVRSREKRTVPAIRTAQYQSSFLPETINMWNSLPEETRHIQSLEEFKETIKAKNETNHLYYTTYTRRAQVLHSRLRLNNADLNDNLANINLAPSSACICGAERETTNHYLTECPNYQPQRNELFDNMEEMQLTSEIMLNGSPDVDGKTNKKLFVEVQKFIITSERFDRD
jgi:hypothetical protein